MSNRPIYIINAFGEIDVLRHVDRDTEAALKKVGNWFEKESDARITRARIFNAIKEGK